VYGIEEGREDEDYTGYEEELAEFEKYGYKLNTLGSNDGGLGEEEEKEKKECEVNVVGDAVTSTGGEAPTWIAATTAWKAKEAARMRVVARARAGNNGADVVEPEEEEEGEEEEQERPRSSSRRRNKYGDEYDLGLGYVENEGEGEEDEDDDLDPLEGWAGGDVVAAAAAARAAAASNASNANAPGDPQLEPGLYLVGTPIGNLEDITLRALRVLRSADAILAEDTRHTRRLLNRYGIVPTQIISYHTHNERHRREPLLNRMRGGAALALVSDAGTPAVADPGADLAAAAAAEGISVIPIPGPCAPAAALVAAGLPTDVFTFIGFLPPKPGARRKRLQLFEALPGTLVSFVPPHKLVATLEDAAAVFGGGRRCAVCREMTKVHEEFYRGTLDAAVAEFTARQPRGEITLVIEGRPDKKTRATISTLSEEDGEDGGEAGAAGTAGTGDAASDLEAFVAAMLEGGVSPSESSKRAAAELGVRRKEAYAVALRLAGKQP